MMTQKRNAALSPQRKYVLYLGSKQPFSLAKNCVNNENVPEKFDLIFNSLGRTARAGTPA
jgi:hypothetical protein